MLDSVTCNITILCECHKLDNVNNNTLLTSNNQCSIVVAIAYVLSHATGPAL